jgi:calcyphosin
MNEYRRDLVERVFIIMDRDNDGLVVINDLKTGYNAKKHPDVMQGKRSVDAVYQEFVETFEEHHK